MGLSLPFKSLIEINLCRFIVDRSVKWTKLDHYPASSLMKIDQHDNFTFSVSLRYHDRGQKWENPDRTKNQSDCIIRYRVLLEKLIFFLHKNVFQYLFLCSLKTRGPNSINRKPQHKHKTQTKIITGLSWASSIGLWLTTQLRSSAFRLG